MQDALLPDCRSGSRHLQTQLSLCRGPSGSASTVRQGTVFLQMPLRRDFLPSLCRRCARPPGQRASPKFSGTRETKGQAGREGPNCLPY